VLRALSGAFLLMIYAFKTIPLSVGMVLFYLWPVFSCLLTSRVTGEATTKYEWAFIGLTLAGVLLIIWPEGSEIEILDIGYFFALGASFLTSKPFGLA